MKLKSLTFLKRTVASLLVAITLTGVLTPVNAVQAATTYTTHSPLLSGDTMAVDEIDPWELTCFAIFMSNFCVPFVDSYDTAFSENGIGSNGAGLNALKFATGGDVTSDSIVRKMLNYVAKNMSGTYKQLIVKNYAIDGSTTGCETPMDTKLDDATKNLMSEYRPAVLADLLPIVSGVFSGRSTVNDSPDFDYNMYASDVWSHAWVAGITDADAVENRCLDNLTITQGVLGDFFIYNGGEIYEPAYNREVFSMRDGWDIQLPSQCLLYSIYKFKDDANTLSLISDILANAGTLNLYMDVIGNICTIYDSRMIIIIPATLNKHITNNGLVNLVNSIVIDTLCSSTNRDIIASGVSGVTAVNTDTVEISGYRDALSTSSYHTDAIMHNAGIGQVLYNDNNISPGTSFLYNIATDYIKPSDRYTTGIQQANFKSFLDSGFDCYTKLRWSTAVRQFANDTKGLDLQNYIAVNESKDANTYFFTTKAGDSDTYCVQFSSSYSEPSYAFTFANQWSRVCSTSDIDGKAQYEKLAVQASVFQTAAQLYTTNVGTNIENIRLYFKQMRAGSDNITCLLDGFDDESAKASVIYTPIGNDFSGKKNSLFTAGNESSIGKFTNYTKILASKVIDMYHGRTIVSDLAGQKSLVNALIQTDTEALNFIDYPAGLTGAINKQTDTHRNSSIVDKLSSTRDKTAAFRQLMNLIIGAEVITEDNEFTEYAKKTLDIEGMYYESQYGPHGDSSTFAGYHCWKLIKQWARICPANPTLSTAASYLGLREGTDFSLFASDMYYTYLDLYGFIAGSHIFNAELYEALGNQCQTMTAEEMADELLLQGLTAEQKQQVLKDNAYLMLSTDEDGRAYRSRMVSGMIEEWLIDTYDKTCYGDTESEYFQTLTSTSKSFVNLPTYAENWLTKWIVSRWDVVLPFIMLFLFVLVAAFGTLNGKKVSWILANLLLTACMLVVLPGAAEIAPYLVEKVSDNAFKDVIGTMTIGEAVEDDAIIADVDKQYEGYSDSIKAAIKSLSALGTSGSLMLKQDMTRKVIPTQTSSVYSELKGLASAQWLLPNLLSMTGADSSDNAYDYVYRAVSEKRTELRQMKYSVNKSVDDETRSYVMNVLNLDATAQASFWHNFDLSTYRSKTTATISTAHLKELFLYESNGTHNNGITLADYTTAYISDITHFDGENYTPAVGYAQGTESILPYFYLVAKDNLLNSTQTEDFTALSATNYFNLFKQNDAGSNSITLTKGNTIDFLDLEFLFTVYMPYLYNMQEDAKKELSDDTLSVAYEAYEDEPKAFLYECNWADKILNAYDFGDDAKPDTYPSRYGREMIFSRAQLVEAKYTSGSKTGQSVEIDDLTEVELRCIEINDEVDKQWTLLINFIATEGVTMDILTEQMALTATIAFNSIMSKDRVINSNYALYPNAVSIRTINFDTMMKLVLMSNFGLADTNQNSMRIVLAESGLLTGFILWILAFLVTSAVPFVAQLSMAVVFYASILSCVYNAAVDGKEKLKTCGGAAMTCLAIGAETCLYVYSYALIIGNTHKVLSVDKIQAGTTVATGKVFAILIVTIIYLALLILQAWKNAVNFRDMGAQMWASYSKKTFDAVTNFAKGFASKIKGAVNPGDIKQRMIQDAVGNIEVKTKIDDEVKVRNDSKNPLFTKESNSADEATYLWFEEDSADNSGYRLDSRPQDMPEPTTLPKSEDKPSDKK